MSELGQFPMSAHNAFGRTLASSIVGGTVSAATGGRFANGAAMAAFGYAFASAVQRQAPQGGQDAHQVGAGAEPSFSKRLLRGALDIAGKIWALPNTAIGLVIGGVSYGAGWAGYGLGLLDVAPSITIGNNAIQFENIPFGNGALTLGNTIIYGGGTAPNQTGNLYGDPRYLNIGRHEMGHTYQYRVSGLNG